MNIFYLHNNPVICARQHCDKHVVKMILEYAQILSTTHRVCDGTQTIEISNGRKIKRWTLNDDRNNVLYKATHINHPSTLWARSSNKNYQWLFSLWVQLLKEYYYRYGKCHKSFSLINHLKNSPHYISDKSFTEPTPAMPEKYKQESSSESYRQYYIHEKNRFASWKNREVPSWYTT